MSLYNQIHIVAIAPDALQLPQDNVHRLRAAGVRVTQTDNFQEGIAMVDVIYMTRLQRERFECESDYERFEQLYVLTKSIIKTVCKPDVVVMHPLPRTGEIHTDVDDLDQAAYFRQTSNGLYVRMALFLLVLLPIDELRNRLNALYYRE